MHRYIDPQPDNHEISDEQAYGLCLLSVIIALIGVGTMVLVLL